MTHDYLIVGAGFYGAVFAERLSTVLGAKVLVVDKRNHIGGNCYSKRDSETGIEFHKYGTHIFHTSDPKVWEYITQFTEFNGYHHQVLTTYKNRVFQMPINLETINTFYGKNLTPTEAEEFMKQEAAKERIGNPKSLEAKAISLIGRPLYEAFIRGYTYKQWGIDPKQLPASIIGRLPIRYTYREDYFNNCRWQGIPLDGYTAIFEKLLSNPNITVKTNCDYFEAKDELAPKKMTIYTGPLDRYFNFKFGRLQWRSIRLERENLNLKDYQGTSVMNYAEESVPFTRIHEPRHLHPEKEREYSAEKTIIFREFSERAEADPFYPINSTENKTLLKKYQELAKAEKGVLFGGRLGDYAYYDMDMTIGAALNKVERCIFSKETTQKAA